MRTLTLGVLIISGGTLAALPFRRYQAIPDASSAPVQVTGPTQSALGSQHRNALVTQKSAEPEGNTSANHALETDLRLADLIRPADLPGERLSPGAAGSKTSAGPQRSRQLDIPLTYDDLAVPIDQPPPIQRRFSATTSVRQQQLERERVTALVMPSMDSLARSQREAIERAAESIASGFSTTASAQDLASGPQPTTGGIGSLASASAAVSQIEQLPESAPADRQRHWIRQPD